MNNLNKWTLPTSINLMGVEWDIRTKYWIVLDVFSAFNNPDYDDWDKQLYCIMSFVKDFDNLPSEYYAEAYERLCEFINAGQVEEKKNTIQLMDWEQDAIYIIPEINKQLGNGTDIRQLPDMHWWTFLSYYMGIGESAFTQIISIRNKIARKEKLDKSEQKFVRENSEIIQLKRHYSKEEQELLDIF